MLPNTARLATLQGVFSSSTKLPAMKCKLKMDM